VCRLYGFRANEPTKVECSLVHAQNALMRQSKSDSKGESHSDGWGIGCYDGDRPAIEKRELAAWEDLHFGAAAERVYARTVIAHVRNATVGGATIENTHPFSHGRWLFAHNGTVRPLDKLRERLEEETESELLARRRGDTDSELTFYWLLSRMRAAGVDLDQKTASAEELAAILVRAVTTLDERSRVAGSERPAMLNFVLTDGVRLAASRHRRTLWWLEREGVHDCEICGIPHIRHDPSVEYRAAVVASEPITNEAWREVPDGSVVAIDEDLRTMVVTI